MSAPRTYIVSTVILWLTVACSPGEVSFRRDVNPILQKNCAVCHTKSGAGYTTSGFSVATYQDMMKGTKYGIVIDPGSSVSSTLVRLIQHKADPSINMPRQYSIVVHDQQNLAVPGTGARSLSEADIDLIVKWVDQGAKNN